MTDRLEALQAGDHCVRVSDADADPAMLRYLAERGIAPGDAFEVVERQPFGGPLFVCFDADVHVLGGELAASMRVAR